DGRDSQSLRDNHGGATAGDNGLKCQAGFGGLDYPGIIAKQRVNVDGQIELIGQRRSGLQTPIGHGGIDRSGVVGSKLRDKHFRLSTALLSNGRKLSSPLHVLRSCARAWRTYNTKVSGINCKRFKALSNTSSSSLYVTRSRASAMGIHTSSSASSLAINSPDNTCASQ